MNLTISERSSHTARGAKLSRQPCLVCQGSLTVHEEVRGGCCGRPACRKQRVQLDVLEQKRRFEENRQRLAVVHHGRQVRHGTLKNSGLVEIATLPAMDRPYRPLPRRRRSAFLQHLREVIRSALGSEVTDPPETLPEHELPGAIQFQAEQPLSQTACATCRGFCCRQGGTRAFLDGITVRRYLASHPIMSPRAIEREYARRIPKVTVKDSCIYHGMRGCTLPREMRAEICNTYHCPELQKLMARADVFPTESRLLVAVDETRAVRSKIVRGQKR